MQPTNIIRLHAFEVDVLLQGSGVCRVKYENGNLVIPVGSPEEAFAFLGRLAPPTMATPLDGVDRTVSNLRKLADQLDGTEAPEVRSVVEEATALAASKLHEVKTNGANGHAKHAEVGSPEAPLKPDMPVDSLRTPPVETPPVNAPGASDEPKTGVRKTTKKADKAPKADPDAKPRNVTDDVADQAKADAAEPPKETAAPSKEPDATSASPEEETQEPAASGLDEAYITSASKMRDIVVHMYEKGVTTVDGILAECAARKDHPVIGKAAMSGDRVERMLMAVGIELPGAGA